MHKHNMPFSNISDTRAMHDFDFPKLQISTKKISCKNVGGILPSVVTTIYT